MVCIHCICRNDDDGWDLTQHLKDEEEAKEEKKKKNKEDEHEDKHENEICGQPFNHPAPTLLTETDVRFLPADDAHNNTRWYKT